MKHVGIDDHTYHRYEEMFLKPRENQHYIVKTKSGWRETKSPWNKNTVLKHLTGLQTVGLFPAPELNYLMFDLDRHNGEDEVNLRLRMQRITNAMPGDPLTYVSSFSGGIRLCYFLEKPVMREGLYHGSKQFLEQKKVILNPGSIEILATRRADRIPFGAGSYLIDPFTLEPIYHLTLKETIAIAYRVFEHQKLEVPFDIPSVDEKQIPYSARESVFTQTVNRLCEEGLYPGITTNDALLKLSYDLIVAKGYTKPEAERFLRSWILTKHNGLSNRFNAGNVDNIYQQIKRIVQGTDLSKAKYYGSKWARRKKRLSLSDVRKIALLTKDPKLQLAVFSLLEYCLCFGKKVKVRINEKVKISNCYGAKKRYVTYGAGLQGNFYCEISKQTLRRLPGFDKAYPQKTIERIRSLGLLSLKREAHQASHHCRQYWVHFDFNEGDPAEAVSLDEGLIKSRDIYTSKETSTIKNIESAEKEVN